METNFIIPAYLYDFISFLERIRAFVVEENTAVEPHLDSYDYFEKKQVFRDTINQMFLKGLVNDILRVKKLLEVAKGKNTNFINRKHPSRGYNEKGIILNQNEVFNNIAIENIKEIDSLINHINNLLADTKPPQINEDDIKLDVDIPTLKGCYNSELVFKNFKKYLKTDNTTFKKWLIDGTGDIKQLHWTYDDENIAQLRALLNALCNVDWKPNEIRTAFKLKKTVDSNNRTGKLNSDLSILLEKCRLK